MRKLLFLKMQAWAVNRPVTSMESDMQKQLHKQRFVKECITDPKGKGQQLHAGVTLSRRAPTS